MPKTTPAKSATTHTPYSTKPFDRLSISNDLEIMRDGLSQVERHDAALLCDNAFRMIVRLSTMLNESKLHVALAKSNLEKGDLVRLAESLSHADKILRLSTEMMPSTMDKDGAA